MYSVICWYIFILCIICTTQFKSQCLHKICQHWLQKEWNKIELTLIIWVYKICNRQESAYFKYMTPPFVAPLSFFDSASEPIFCYTNNKLIRLWKLIKSTLQESTKSTLPHPFTYYRRVVNLLEWNVYPPESSTAERTSSRAKTKHLQRSERASGGDKGPKLSLVLPNSRSAATALGPHCVRARGSIRKAGAPEPSRPNGRSISAVCVTHTMLLIVFRPPLFFADT